MSALRRAGPRQGAPARRHPGPALLRATGPARLKRRWCCADPDCEERTWTEGSPYAPSRAVLTVRAGAEATRQVGELALPIAVVAKELGVCWWTVMDAVVRHGTPLVEDPERVGWVRALGIDETSFLSVTCADGARPKSRSGSRPSKWSPRPSPRATGGAIAEHLEHTVRFADPFHGVRVADRCVDKVRPRVQNATLGHPREEDGPALSDPQALALGLRTPRRAWPRAHAARAAPGCRRFPKLPRGDQRNSPVD